MLEPQPDPSPSRHDPDRRARPKGHVSARPDGKISDEIKDSKHILFGMSNAIPNPLIATVRPRAVSVVALDDKFVISYLEARVEAPNQIMAGWIEALRKA